MTFIPAITNVVDPNNSTTSISGTTFTGTSTDVSKYTSIRISVYSSTASTSSGCVIQFSTDNSTWRSDYTFTVSANTHLYRSVPVNARYYRLVYTSSTSTPTIIIQSMLLTIPNTTAQPLASASIPTDLVVPVTNSVSYGLGNDGTSRPFNITGEGHLEVAIHAPILPFGSVHSESLTPIFQADAVYGINLGQNLLAGNTDMSNNCMYAYTGTGVYGYGYIESRKRLRYRAGQGLVGRFSALYSGQAGFSANDLSGTYQIAGFGHPEDGIYIGYKAGVFGVLYTAFGTREVRTLTVTYTSGNATAATITLNGTAFSVTFSGNLTSANTIAYELATRGTYTGWNVEQRGSTVLFIANDVGAYNGTFSATITGGTSTGSFATTITGSSLATETFIPQSSFNIDKLDGTGPSKYTINPQYGNVFQMNIQYLGFGSITFLVEVTYTDTNNSDFLPFHVLKIPNTSLKTTFKNPSLPFLIAAYNKKNATIPASINVMTGSYAGFVEGAKVLHGNRFTYSRTAASVTATSTPIFTIASSRVYGGKANQSVINLLSISAGADNTKTTEISLVRNLGSALTGPVSFAEYAPGYSVTYLDQGATGVGTLQTNAAVGAYTYSQIIWSSVLPPNGSLVFHFTDDITLQPGETITVIARSTSGTATSVGISLNTREDQ